MISHLNALNYYTPDFTIENLCLITRYDYSVFLKQYQEVLQLTLERQEALLAVKKRRVKTNISVFRHCHKQQNQAYQKLCNDLKIHTGIDLNTSYKQSDIFERMVKKTSYFHIVNTLYAKTLLTSIQYAKTNPELWYSFKKQVQEIGVDFKNVSALLRSLHYQNETDYHAATQRITDNFKAFYHHDIHRDLDTLLLEAMSFSMIFQHTTPCFTVYHTRLIYPEIYLIKACLSQALQQVR